MAGFLLNAGAVVLCAHGGTAHPVNLELRVKVLGQPVVTQPAPFIVAGCPNAPNGIAQPCVTAQWRTAAGRVRVSGRPVVLQDSEALCSPTGTPLSVVVTQLRVRGS